MAEFDSQLLAGSRLDRQIIEKFLLVLILLGAGCTGLVSVHGPIAREANRSDKINGLVNALVH